MRFNLLMCHALALICTSSRDLVQQKNRILQTWHAEANCPSLFDIFGLLWNYITLETSLCNESWELPMHCPSQDIKKIYGTTNVKMVFLSFQRDIPSKQSVTDLVFSADMFSRMKSCFHPNSRGWSTQILLSDYFFLSFCSFSTT